MYELRGTYYVEKPSTPGKLENVSKEWVDREECEIGIPVGATSARLTFNAHRFHALLELPCTMD